MPRGYHATTLFPEYYHIGGRWSWRRTAAWTAWPWCGDGAVSIVEFRNVRAGELVVVGRTEDGSEGIYVHPNCFVDQSGEAEAFAFRTGRSRETAYSIDYDGLYDLLRHERSMGISCGSWDRPVPLTPTPGPPLPPGAGRLCQRLMAGNALATHDLEAGYLGTALGQDVYTQQAHFNGHYNHIDTLNAIRLCGSTAAFVEAGKAKDGIIYECVRNHIPYVLVGSVRDDGLCPRSMETCMKGRTPCAPWCGRPPRLSAWPPPSIPWPPAT